MPYPRSTRFQRAGWLLAALFQLILPTFASIADARAEAIGATAVAHIESHGMPSCVPVHPADCAVCRTLSSGAAPARAIQLAVVAVRLVPTAAARPIEVIRSAIPAGDPPQRAPPALS